MRVRLTVRRAGLALAGLAAAGALFWLVAPYNIAASLPHLPGVRWLLHGYMHNAARTWSIGLGPPAYLDLADPALIRLGAGHYRTGCATCHGAPGLDRSPIVRQMRPAPPTLDHVADYRPRELYWIVRNGLKYTGMPGWPGARRPDEPWALVAFLRALPGLDAAAYRALVGGHGRAPADAGRAVAFGFAVDPAGVDDLCAGCHGEDGQGRDGTAPALAGQSEAYLAATLDAYADGSRESGMMEPLAAALPAAERARLSRRYAAMPPPATTPATPAPAGYERGAELAQEGDEGHDIPSCLSCHGEGLTPPRKPLYPRLAGQDRRWLITWLRRWREGPIGGTRYARVMHAAARPLDDAEIDALATFFAAGGGDATPPR